MPAGDGSGPWWAQGGWNCRRGRGFGMGFGRGYGFGRGFGAGYWAVPPRGVNQSAPQIPKEQEASELKVYAEELKAELNAVIKKLKELE